jgi:hypothetical protein
MSSIIDETVFSEPSGQPVGIIQLCAALLFLGAFGYAIFVENSPLGSWPLFMTAGSALSGIAESLPNNRRQAAGVLRLTAFFALLCLLVSLLFGSVEILKS